MFNLFRLEAFSNDLIIFADPLIWHLISEPDSIVPSVNINLILPSETTIQSGIIIWDFIQSVYK